MRTTRATWKPILIDWNRKRGRSVNRSHIYQHNNVGAKIADKVTAFVGSWTFFLLHAVWFGLWIGLHVEPFPFGLLTMIVSLEAIALTTLVMMSQNRQAERDRKRDDLEANEVTDILGLHQETLQINRTQLEILKQQSEILDLLKDPPKNAREETLRENAELLKQTNALMRQIKALDKLKPEV